MKYKLFKLCSIIFCFIQLGVAATELRSINCDPQLQPTVIKILKIAEARDLIAKIQQEGPFQIVVNNHVLSRQFGAYWDMEKRTVCINLPFHETEGRVIGFILFELHNAVVTSQLDALDDRVSNGKISKEDYVEAVEFIEFQNSQKTAQLAQKGIDLGFFPKDARLPTYNTFEEHFRIQKIGGHSAWIERTYNELSRPL